MHRSQTVVGYHFGWWPAVRDSAVAVPWELAHNSSLVHDDVMDGDRMRHHRPTVWRVFGMRQTILVGDALVALAVQLVGGECGAAGCARLIG